MSRLLSLGRQVRPQIDLNQIDVPVVCVTRTRKLRQRRVERGSTASAGEGHISRSFDLTRVGFIGPKGRGRGSKPRSRTVCSAGSPWTADQVWGLVVGVALVAVWFLSTKVDKLVADAQRRQLRLDEQQQKQKQQTTKEAKDI